MKYTGGAGGACPLSRKRSFKAPSRMRGDHVHYGREGFTAAGLLFFFLTEYNTDEKNFETDDLDKHSNQNYVPYVVQERTVLY